MIKIKIIMNDSTSCHCGNKVNEVAIADWRNPHRSISVNNTAGEGDEVLNGEGARSTLMNLFHDRHVELDSVDMDMEVSSLSRVHPTNGGTMMTLVDDTVSVQTPHSKATEPRRRVQEIIARSQQQEMFNEIQWRQEFGGDEVHGEFSDTDFDDLLLLAAESCGWIDELDIYERKGCPFLIKNRGKVKNDQENSLE
mmetsp:Transcript_19815/g.40727  ORF Transcript_19815/g.40727 Transcript_19815/m.40727 type:complete len:196 (+) Transcript_19815:216-803(+)